MKLNLVQKILESHNLNYQSQELEIYPDQVMTPDSTATMVYLQLEAMGVKQVKPFSVIYIDHNMLQVGHKNPDDHRYLLTVGKKLGAYISKAGNGIGHTTHLENFSKPGVILLGSDSHTATAGAAGMLAIGAGGIDVAIAMSGLPYIVTRPKVVGVYLAGSLKPWVTAKDISLKLMQLIGVKGGKNKLFEYYGPGVSKLTVYDRATICNMGAETGAFSSIFPSDDMTKLFYQSIGRESAWQQLLPDEAAEYDEVIEIDLDMLEPLIALPHSPDNIKPVSEVEGVPLSQVGIGSCTNSSFKDLAIAAAVLKNQMIPESIDLIISPGSKRILLMLLETGMAAQLVTAGARLLEVACGPCNGIGQAPASGTNTLRTYNRNFKGRCGTSDANSYLCSPETAAVSALYGKITDPRRFGEYPIINEPAFFPLFTDAIIAPKTGNEAVQVIKGPNIKPIPVGTPLEDTLTLKIELKTGDNITTDHILPGGAEMLALRSNIPDSVPYIFSRLNPDFKDKISNLSKTWCIIGGDNFGMGSSREHAVMVPMFAGMKLVIAKSFATVYKRNLINFGVIPLVFENPADYESLQEGDQLILKDCHNQLKEGRVKLFNETQDCCFSAKCEITSVQQNVLSVGGLLNFVKDQIQ